MQLTWLMSLATFLSMSIYADPPRVSANRGATLQAHGLEADVTAADNQAAEGLWRIAKDPTEKFERRNWAILELDSKAKFLSLKSQSEFADYISPYIIKRDAVVLGAHRFARMELLSQLGFLGAEGWAALDGLLSARREAIYVQNHSKDQIEKRYAERIEQLVSLSVGRILADRVKKGNKQSVAADLKKSIKEGLLQETDLPILAKLLTLADVKKLDPESLQVAALAIESAQNDLAGKPKVEANHPMETP